MTYVKVLSAAEAYVRPDAQRFMFEPDLERWLQDGGWDSLDHFYGATTTNWTFLYRAWFEVLNESERMEAM